MYAFTPGHKIRSHSGIQSPKLRISRRSCTIYRQFQTLPRKREAGEKLTTAAIILFSLNPWKVNNSGLIWTIQVATKQQFGAADYFWMLRPGSSIVSGPGSTMTWKRASFFWSARLRPLHENQFRLLEPDLKPHLEPYISSSTSLLISPLLNTLHLSTGPAEIE